MDSEEIANIYETYSYLNKNTPDLDRELEWVLKAINEDNIDDIDSLSSGLAFLHGREQFTAAVTSFFDRYLSQFTSEGMQIKEPDYTALHFLHSMTYNLIFPNIYNPAFEHTVKNVFSKIYTNVIEPALRNLYDHKIFSQKDYGLLKDIQSFKSKFKNKVNYEYLRQSVSNNLTEGEVGALKLILKSLINKHAAYHSSIEKAIKSCTSHLKGEFRMGPTKHFDRTFTKLKEAIQEDPRSKFPLHKLKDLTRCSVLFEDAAELLCFLNAFKDDLQSNKCDKLQILEIKNMFHDQSEEKKYAYKDVKLILGFQIPSGDVLLVEVQLILRDILKLKKVLHKFYDVTRTDSGPLRSNLYNCLYASMSAKNEVCWDRSEPMFLFHENLWSTEDFVKKQIEGSSKGDLVTEEYYNETSNRKIYNINGTKYKYLNDTYYNVELYVCYQFQSDSENNKVSSSKSKNGNHLNIMLIDEEFLACSLGDEKLILTAYSNRITIINNEIKFEKIIELKGKVLPIYFQSFILKDKKMVLTKNSKLIYDYNNQNKFVTYTNNNGYDKKEYIPMIDDYVYYN